MTFLTPNILMSTVIRPAAALAAMGCAIMAVSTSALADDHCPSPALSVPGSPITTVDKQNYSLAETQVIF